MQPSVTRSSSNSKRSLLLFLVVCICLLRLLSTNSVGGPENKPSSETAVHVISHDQNEADLLVYDLPKNYTKPLRHLDEIDPSILQVVSSKNPYYPIDLVHRKGWMHAGGWLHVLDKEHKLLLLRRGPQLVTSPNAWSLVGEHAYRNETPLQTAYRGLLEELGLQSSSSSSPTSLVTFTIQNLTQWPILYLRDYGPSNDGRIDRQITYMWYVQLNQPHVNVPLQLDDEVADHTWMELNQVREWVQGMYQYNNNNKKKKNDFGYPETQALILKGIELLLKVTQQRHYKST